MKNEKETRDLLELFSSTCNDLAKEVNDVLFEGCRDWYWVGEQVGGLCAFEDTDFLTPDEMYLILAYKVSYETYADWREWNLAYGDIVHNFNLWSWIHGADKVAKARSEEYECKTREGQ